MKTSKITVSSLLEQSKDNPKIHATYIRVSHLMDIVSFLADMAEYFLKDAQDEMRKVNLVMRQEDKLNQKMFKDYISKARAKARDIAHKTFVGKDEKDMTPEKQEWICDRSDKLYNMMRLIVNRTTNDNEGLQEIYDAVKALPKKRDVFDEKYL